MRIFFSYLFFFLFVFVSLSVLVSTFSDTFSQLYVLLTQEGRIFNLFLYALYLLGFAFCIYALILSSWNQRYNPYYKGGIILCALGFTFALCFSLAAWNKPMDLLDFVFDDQKLGGYGKDPYALFIFGGFYCAFILFPLGYKLLGLRFKQHALGEFLSQLKPSINISIYTLMGFALQGYFNKAKGIYYLDLFCFLVGVFMLVLFYSHHKKQFGFYEKTNLVLLCAGVIFFSLSSNTIEEANFIARYCFFVFAFVAWCGEWMFEYANPNVKNLASKKIF